MIGLNIAEIAAIGGLSSREVLLRLLEKGLHLPSAYESEISGYLRTMGHGVTRTGWGLAYSERRNESGKKIMRLNYRRSLRAESIDA